MIVKNITDLILLKLIKKGIDVKSNLGITICALGFVSQALGMESKTLEPTELYEKAYEYVLKIDTSSSLSAYGEEGSGTASGFWLGGNSRLIVTNAHVASTNQISQIHAEDAHGNKIKLKFIYSNPLIDLAYLEPEDKVISQPKTMLKFNTKPELNSNVYMIGNNGGNGIVLQDGRISDTYKIDTTTYPRKNIIVSINGKGGSSGSMVLDDCGNIVGVNYGGYDAANFIIPAEFLIEDINCLMNKKFPSKKDLGLVFKHIKEGDAKKYYNYSSIVEIIDYNQQFPGAQSRLLQVERCLLGTPGDLEFQPGDIITHVNDSSVGPDLFLYSNKLNNVLNDQVEITFNRNGEEKRITVDLFDLNKSKCQDMVVFGKSVLSYVDPILSYVFGAKVGAVGIFQNPNGNIFYDNVNTTEFQDSQVACFCINWIDNIKINHLNDVVNIIPSLSQKQAFSYVYVDYANAYQRPKTATVEYDPEHHQGPVRMTFDFDNSKWVKQKIKVSDKK